MKENPGCKHRITCSLPLGRLAFHLSCVRTPSQGFFKKNRKTDKIGCRGTSHSSLCAPCAGLASPGRVNTHTPTSLALCQLFQMGQKARKMTLRHFVRPPSPSPIEEVRWLNADGELTAEVREEDLFVLLISSVCC